MLDHDIRKLLIPPSDKRWIDFVNSSPDSNIFHHPVWISLMAKCYGYQPFVTVIFGDQGEIIAGTPMMEVNSWLTGRRWLSLPFTDHCQPLYDTDAGLQQLLAYLTELQSIDNVPRIEIRSILPVSKLSYEDNNQVLHRLRLSPNADSVYQNFHKSQVKRNITKAEREGVTTRRAENKNDLDTFYRLQVKTRRRLGVPVQPKRYFDLLWETIIQPGLGFILLAFKDAIPIAGGVFLTYNNTLVYKYGASDSNYWQFRANHQLFWVAIQWGCENGYAVFDWGKSDVHDPGLREFKDRWGAQESTLTYSILSTTPPKQSKERLSNVIKPFIQRAPMWVCRLTGELLYRYAA
jgi:CelD/BcsL family acetyltransferase involved in cellulose biosynthesis